MKTAKEVLEVPEASEAVVPEVLEVPEVPEAVAPVAPEVLVDARLIELEKALSLGPLATVNHFITEVLTIENPLERENILLEGKVLIQKVLIAPIARVAEGLIAQRLLAIQTARGLTELGQKELAAQLLASCGLTGANLEASVSTTNTSSISVAPYLVKYGKKEQGVRLNHTEFTRIVDLPAIPNWPEVKETLRQMVAGSTRSIPIAGIAEPLQVTKN